MSSDCLAALREQFSSSRPNIVLKSSDGRPTTDIKQTAVLIIGGREFPRTAATRYISASGGSGSVTEREYYPLDAVYFAFLRRDLPHHEYFQECQQLGISPVSLVVKRDLFDYLSGKSDASANIDSSADSKRGISDANDFKDMKRQKVIGLRVIRDRQNVLSCRTNKSFENIGKMATDIIIRGKKGSASLAIEKKPTGDSTTSTATSGSKLPPIILVPVALTSVITLYNAKGFFESGQFKTTDEIRKAGGVKQNPITIKRANPRPGQATHFQIYDSIDKIQPEDWDRVVAVFVGGQSWQFQRWKWEDPAELFTNVLGFYLKYADASVDSTVKQWNVTVLEINRYKRHLDAQCLHKFWNILDQWIGARKPHLIN